MNPTLAQREGQILMCQGLVRDHDFIRYSTALLSPSEARAGLFALYAFNVEIGRVREHITQAMSGEIRMQWWADALAGKAESEAAGNPVAAALTGAVEHYQLPLDRLTDLIEARRFDLYDDPMPSLAELEVYLHRSAGALFDLSALIVEPAQAVSDELVRHAGLAQGLTALVTALPLHASCGQCYLPADLLAQHGIDGSRIVAGTAGVTNVVGILAARAGDHLREAMTLLASAPTRSRAAFLPLAMTLNDLRRLAKLGNDPFRLSPPSRLGTLWTMWRASRSAPFAR